MSISSGSIVQPVGTIRINGPVGGCDQAIEQLRKVLEEARVYFPLPDQTGYSMGSDTPGVDDRDKPWLKITETTACWMYWSCKCQKWCQVGGKPGERVTRYRINDTVQEDLDAYYSCGWELADGSNILGIDLRDFADGTPGIYAVLLPAQDEWCIDTIQTSEDTYNIGGAAGITADNVDDLVVSLNTYFSGNGTPLSASNNNGVLELTANDLSIVQQVFECDSTPINVVERQAPVTGSTGDEVPNDFFGRDSSSPTNEYSYYTLIYTGVCNE